MEELMIKSLKLIFVQLLLWGIVPTIIKLDSKLNKVIPLGNYKEATIIETFCLSVGVFFGWILAI